MKKYGLLLLIISIISCQPTTKLPENIIDAKYENQIDELFIKYAQPQPGASVLVIKNEQIVFAKSYGLADRERQTKATNASNYRIASLTKQFTAAGILLLIEEGKLTYQTTLKDIFPDFPAYGKTVTIQHLLTHRSGLIHYRNFIEAGQTEQLLDNDVLKGLMKTDSTYFPAGSQYKYSNSGYAVLAEVIAKVSGITFQDFMSKRIFQPLGMTNATVFDVNTEIKNRAYGYLVKDNSITFKDQSLTSAIQGDGGIYLSILDYYKWDKSLTNNQLLKLESIENAFSAWDENGKTEADGYGFGWKINTDNNLKYIEHGGSTAGFGTHVIRVPEQKLTALIFTNRNKTGNGLRTKCKALLSYFSDGKILMPIEILIEQEITKNGITAAIDLYDKLKLETDKYANSKNALYSLGINYFRTGKYLMAKDLFEKTVTEFPDFYAGFYGLAITFQQLENKEKAIEYFEKTLKIIPSSQQGIKNYCTTQIGILKK